MDGEKKLLLISFSLIPNADQHTAKVTGTVRALNRLFEAIDIISIKGEYLAHIERYHASRLLRVPLVGDDGGERGESFRRAVRRQIDSENYDVVHIRSPLEGLPIIEAKQEKGYRVVYEAGNFAFQDAAPHVGDEESLKILEQQLRRDEITCATEADLVVAHSKAAKKALRARGVSRPIEVISAGVNIDVFDWEYALEPTVPTLLCLGRLEPWRDVKGVLEALRRVLEVTPVCLQWVGEAEPEQREEARRIAVDLGVEHDVSFEPPPDLADLPPIISAATICLAPMTPAERFVEWGDLPPSFLELMACQRPVVAARTPGVEEVVRDGTEALLYTPGDPSGLTSSILFLLRNKRHQRLLAKRGYRRVREHHSESAQRRQILQAYRELLGLAQGYDLSRGDLAKDSQHPSVVPDAATVDGEPVTAVMHTARESESVRIESDTAQFNSASSEVPFDTQPSIVVDESNDEASWSVDETSPHLDRLGVDDIRPETRRLAAIPPTPDDTSRIAVTDIPVDPDSDRD